MLELQGTEILLQGTGFGGVKKNHFFQIPKKNLGNVFFPRFLSPYKKFLSPYKFFFFLKNINHNIIFNKIIVGSKKSCNWKCF